MDYYLDQLLDHLLSLTETSSTDQYKRTQLKHDIQNYLDDYVRGRLEIEIQYETAFAMQIKTLIRDELKLILEEAVDPQKEI